MTIARTFFRALPPLLLGLAAFLAVVGPRVLDPTNIAWLESADTAQHYLGWLFFRQGSWTLSPVMIWRLHPAIGHDTLAGHFIILAALYLALRPDGDHRRIAWGLLIVVASLVHAYLLAVVVLIWLCDIDRHADVVPFVDFAAIIPAMLAACWAAGYFETSAIAAPGYGLYRFDLAGFLDPGKPSYGLWSRFMPDLAGDAGQHEGFAYLGMGVLALLAFALAAIALGRVSVIGPIRTYRPLAVLLVLLFLFAATNQVRMAGMGFDYPLPDFILRIAQIFRASARMIWPVYYMVVLLAVFAVARGYGPRSASLILVAVLAVQIADTSSGWVPIRAHYMQPTSTRWHTPLQSSFWQEAAQVYDKVRAISDEPVNRRWRALSYYAGTHGMTTDAVYLARLDAQKRDDLRRRNEAVLESGRYDADTLYILAADKGAEARASLDTAHDALMWVDGILVVAPGWRAAGRH
ncbi:hypothetical protein C8N35_108145 [Breoghania corrubedonensis]|uniref:Uncharacterized protein n=1 Tax=Breoghania corrubedonensis TaxID=665038 RepID=A0A2T5V5T3_9HYPH|nr:DUF6311 domain-containing protein [Breoghania corrubedonensis]PTW59108.1 hypothetical protein C8N35_108145 [Breoghania corrubedonensis]